jgi:hypothetical protein
VEIMRARHFTPVAIIVGATLLIGGCATPGGVAGVGPLAPIPHEDGGGSPPGTVLAIIPVATTAPAAPVSVERPPADDPVPVPPPRLSKYTYAFPVKGCSVEYERRKLVLPKTTIWAAKGCAFVAPVDGVVDEVNARNRWVPSTDRGPDREGRFVSVIGADGVRYLGGHLDTVAEGIAPGVKVKAGQTLGTVGNSGNARDTASNLYFAISWDTGPEHWWIRRGMVGPWDYLDAWKDGNRTLSPRDEVRALRKKLGTTPPCTVLCASKTPPKKVRQQAERPPETEEPPLVLNPIDG